MNRREQRGLVRRISLSRNDIDARMRAAGILGSMIGLKMSAGALTKEIGLTCFVRKKLPVSRLRAGERVPRRVRLGADYIRTDVLEWPLMADQSSDRPEIISDQRTQGTFSCYGESPIGLFGVSCAHCLVGTDRNPATPTQIDRFDRSRMTWGQVGSSVYLAYSPGLGTRGNFGYLDCGLFDLHDMHPSSIPRSFTPARLVDSLDSLIGTTLIGISALSPSGFPSPERVGYVHGVEASCMDELSDVILRVESPGTFRGDSGMLWLTEDGRLAAIHARGEVVPGGSRVVTAMHAKRAARALGVRFLLAAD